MTAINVIDVISIVASIGALIVAVYTYRANVVHDRKQATLDAYNILQEQALDKLYVYMPKEIQQIAKNRRSETFKEIGAYVARIEHFAVGVNQGIYDEEIVYELAHGFLDGGIRTRFKVVIEAKERESDEEFYPNIRLLLYKMDKESERRKKHRR